MNLVSLDSVIEFVMPYVSGCPRSLVIREIKECAIDFCEKTGVWRHEMTPISILENISVYELEIPGKTRVVDIKSLQIGSLNVKPKTAEWLDTHSPGWRTTDGTAVFYVQEGPELIRLDRTPTTSITNAINATLTLKPSRIDGLVDEFILNDWTNTLAEGARAKLLLTPSKQWSNPELGDYFDNNYRIGVSNAKTKSNKGYSQADLSVTRRRIV